MSARGQGPEAQAAAGNPAAAGDPTAPAARAARLIAQTQNMVLATAGPDGTPWVTPLFFVPDGAAALLWTSEPSAQHSLLIRASPSVSITIFQDAPGRPVDAVYIEALVRELSDPAEIERAIPVMAAKPQPERWRIVSAADISGDGPWRAYRAEFTALYVRSQETVAGRPVARREPVDLAALARQP